MRNVKVLCGLIVILSVGTFAQSRHDGFQAVLPSGPFVPGFRLIETSDASRSFPSEGPDGAAASDEDPRLVPRETDGRGADATRGLRPDGPRGFPNVHPARALTKGLDPKALQDSGPLPSGPSATPAAPRKIPAAHLRAGLVL